MPDVVLRAQTRADVAAALIKAVSLVSRVNKALDIRRVCPGKLGFRPAAPLGTIGDVEKKAFQGLENASWWGWIGAGAVVASAVGYARRRSPDGVD